MRRCGAVVVAAAALLAASSVPASAQDLGDVDVLELPQLGFEIAQEQGFPGDMVLGQVNPEDTAEYCLSVDGLVGNVVTEVDGSIDEWAEGPTPSGFTEEEVEIFADAVWTLRVGVQAFEDTAMQLWEETFVFTFADAVTQELLGDTGNFDPATGEGSIVVPPLDPDVYGLAAACVQLASADALVAGGYDAGAASFWEWVDSNDIVVPDDRSEVNEEWQDFVEESALEWVPELVTPRAVGIQVFCVLNPDGLCGDEPAEQLEPEEPAEELEVAAAEVVDARPAFTG